MKITKLKNQFESEIEFEEIKINNWLYYPEKYKQEIIDTWFTTDIKCSIKESTKNNSTNKTLNENQSALSKIWSGEYKILDNTCPSRYLPPKLVKIMRATTKLYDIPFENVVEIYKDLINDRNEIQNKLQNQAVYYHIINTWNEIHGGTNLSESAIKQKIADIYNITKNAFILTKEEEVKLKQFVEKHTLGIIKSTKNRNPKLTKNRNPKLTKNRNPKLTKNRNHKLTKNRKKCKSKRIQNYKK